MFGRWSGTLIAKLQWREWDVGDEEVGRVWWWVEGRGETGPKLTRSVSGASPREQK